MHNIEANSLAFQRGWGWPFWKSAFAFLCRLLKIHWFCLWKHLISPSIKKVTINLRHKKTYILTDGFSLLRSKAIFIIRKVTVNYIPSSYSITMRLIIKLKNIKKIFWYIIGHSTGQGTHNKKLCFKYTKKHPIIWPFFGQRE